MVKKFLEAQEQSNPWQDIHEDLFQKTTEHQYYMFGVAFSMFSIYKVLNKFKNQRIHANDIQEAIKDSAKINEGVNKYFDKLIKTLNKEDKLNEFK